MSLSRPRRTILAGAGVTVMGLALAGTAPVVGVGAAERIQGQQAIGGIVMLVGWALLGWGIHRFGRES